METKTSAQIVDELFKELQGKSNLAFNGNHSAESSEEKSERCEKTELPKARKTKRKHAKDDASNTDSDTANKQKTHRRKHKKKKKKKKQDVDNSSKSHKHYSKRRHKHKHRSDGESEKIHSGSDSSVEIEWESDHNSNANCKDGKEKDASKELCSKLDVNRVVLLENRTAIESCLSNDEKGKVHELSLITNEQEKVCQASQFRNDSPVKSVKENCILKIEGKCNEISNNVINLDNDSSKDNAESCVHSVMVKTEIILRNSEANYPKEGESEAQLEKSNKVLPSEKDLNSTEIEVAQAEDAEQTNNADNISKDNDVGSPGNSDERKTEPGKKKKKKSSKKRKKHGKKRKHASEEGVSKEKKHGSRSRSKSRSPHKSKKSRRSRSHSVDLNSGLVGQSPSHQHKKKKYRDRESRSSRRSSESPSRQKRYSRSRSRDRERRRSRSPRKSYGSETREKIDKAKLLEIARKNAMVMISQGKLPAGVNIDGLKKEQLVTLKSGGKSVEELTDFCKQLVKKDGDTSSSDSEKNGLCSDDEGEGPFIQHPFKLRDAQPNIVLNIRNAVQIPVKTPAEKAAETAKLRIQFPVSSGSQHRKKESEWIPVSTQAKDTLPVVPILPPNDKVFQEKPPKPEIIDVGTIISQRLQAVRKLQENPQDVEALSQMYCAQQQMQSWAESKQLPGQFTGVTDARLLTPAELAGPAHTQAWVKKDLFNKAAPIDGGMGMYLLRKMGWNPGEGLGKNKEGTVEPLVLDIKTDKKGLTSSDETAKKIAPPVPVLKDLSGKHPVSALVELCSKRKWGSPEFILIHDSGPDHKKNFLFKVRINNVEYQPSIASPSKKHAKAQAATICLQNLGLLPRNYTNLNVN